MAGLLTNGPCFQELAGFLANMGYLSTIPPGVKITIGGICIFDDGYLENAKLKMKKCN